MNIDFVQLMFYGVVILSLFLVDYALGNGFVQITQKVVCRVFCTIKNIIQLEDKNPVVPNSLKTPIYAHFFTFFTELVILSLTFSFLKKYKEIRNRKDRIEDLLQESRDSLRITEEFLEKWRLRRVLTEASYLDEEPQNIAPLKLELPILHMAIVDTSGSHCRSQPESGDAGDNDICSRDLFSVVSLAEDFSEDVVVKPSVEKPPWEQHRYLWDVLEEDPGENDDF